MDYTQAIEAYHRAQDAEAAAWKVADEAREVFYAAECSEETYQTFDATFKAWETARTATEAAYQKLREIRPLPASKA